MSRTHRHNAFFSVFNKNNNNNNKYQNENADVMSRLYLLALLSMRRKIFRKRHNDFTTACNMPTLKLII